MLSKYCEPGGNSRVKAAPSSNSSLELNSLTCSSVSYLTAGKVASGVGSWYVCFRIVFGIKPVSSSKKDDITRRLIGISILSWQRRYHSRSSTGQKFRVASKVEI